MKGIWQLDAIPAYSGGGELSSEFYDSGTSFYTLSSATPLDARTQYITNASFADYEAYLKTLREAGYSLESETRLGENRYTHATDGVRRIHVIFVKKLSAITVTDEGKRGAFSEISYQKTTEKYKGAFFLYGLNMDPGGYNPLKDPILNSSDEVKRYSKKNYYAGDITRTIGFSKIDGEIKEIFKYDKFL